GLQPVAFFDDDATKHGSSIHNVPVLGPPEGLLNGKGSLALEGFIIAMPSASARRMGEVVKIAQEKRLRVETVPSLAQLAMGQVRVSQLRNVEIADLLG